MKPTYTINRILVSPNNGIEAAANVAYEFLLNQTSLYPVHIRNFIPDILKEVDGTNTYKRFCSARKEFYDKNDITDFPSACGVGSETEYLEVVAILSDVNPIRLSSRMQEEPSKYPSTFGTPLFSRGSIVGDDIFVSGTASIRGSETMFPGDVIAQLRLTLDAIRDIMSSQHKKLEDCSVITYVKHESDIPEVSAELKKQGITSKIINVDICRDDLLVEIEILPKGIL